MKNRGLTLAVVGGFFAMCLLVVFFARGRKHEAEPEGSDDPNAVVSALGAASAVPSSKPAPKVEILVSTSDGKKEWMEDVAKDFMARNPGVKVKLLHMKSGESMQAILDGKEKPAVWSPASGSWIELINTTWKTRTGQTFLDGAKPTVVSPLVIATWEPMARALGWPTKAIGWEEISKVANDPKGWASVGHPEWGTFRFGHAHPDYSTSAMLSVLSSVYAAAGKTKGLTADDLKNPKVIERVGALERGIVHYGESSSFLTEKLATKGPAYLSAVPLYESSVVAANDKYKAQLPFKLVALYPKEGTFWEDHPSGVVRAEWVSAEQRDAAEKLVAFMTAKEQQEKALKYGYRPTDASIPIGAPVDEAHGADAKQAKNALEYVPEDLFRRANELWHKVKKHSTVFMLLDTSGSMQGKPILAAKKGAAQFIRSMEKDDEIGVIVFSTQPRLLRPLAKVSEVGETLAQQVEGLFADGQTSLYDAALQGMAEIEKHKKGAATPRLYGIVLLSDGKDTSSKKALSDLTDQMPATEAADGTRLFTVAYGDEADKDVLKQLATRSNARYLEGNADNIEKIYHQISAYF